MALGRESTKNKGNSLIPEGIRRESTKTRGNQGNQEVIKGNQQKPEGIKGIKGIKGIRGFQGILFSSFSRRLPRRMAICQLDRRRRPRRVAPAPAVRHIPNEAKSGLDLVLFLEVPPPARDAEMVLV